MDFYLLPKRFLTDLAVNAKSCLNSNHKTAIFDTEITTHGIEEKRAGAVY